MENEKMAFSEFFEKLFGIKLNDYQKKMLEDYYQNSNKSLCTYRLETGKHILTLCVQQQKYGMDFMRKEK